VIPEAAVEAAAKAIHEAAGWDWEDATGWREICATNEARAALEAAAPHMLAPVIDLADELAASKLGGDTYRDGRGSGFRIAGIRIRQVLGLTK